ncbi:MAG: thioredoxin family protein [Flavobacteriales bacterium]|nr:MAG: thioredoxin family protein [Flavobacteriales bacterium]
MNWTDIKSESDLDYIIEKSFQTNIGVAIFKHSTRCSISSVAKKRLESSWSFNQELPAYHLDLLQYRNLSNSIAERFNIQHESPQVLIIKNGECIYDASHLAISVKDLEFNL